VSGFVGIVERLPVEIRVELGEWAWQEALPYLALCKEFLWNDKDYEFNKYNDRDWKLFFKEMFEMDGGISFCEIAVACLGEFEVRKRLEELK